LLYLIDNSLIFDGKSSLILNDPYTIDSYHLSIIVADDTVNLDHIRNVFEHHLEIFHSTPSDRRIVKRVCELIGLRAARLGACSIVGMLEHTNALNEYNVCNIAVDGCMFEFYPNFKKHIYDALRELLGDDIESKVKLNFT